MSDVMDISLFQFDQIFKLGQFLSLINFFSETHIILEGK